VEGLLEEAADALARAALTGELRDQGIYRRLLVVVRIERRLAVDDGPRRRQRRWRGRSR
jgi:hypothetical protein